MEARAIHRDYYSLKHKIFIDGILTIQSIIVVLLLTTSCGNDNTLIPAKTTDAPSNLVARAISRGEIELTWKDNSSDEDGFYIERRTAPMGVLQNFQEIAQTGADITTYRDKSSTIKPDTTYYYRVAYYRGNEVSKYSNEASAETLKKVVLWKKTGCISSDKGDFSETEGVQDGEKGLSLIEEECILMEQIAEGNQNLCGRDGEEIVLFVDSPWINSAVLDFLIYGDNTGTGLQPVPGLTEAQIEEMKKVAIYVQSSFLSLDRTPAGLDSEEGGTEEITRQAREILLTADQKLMELLDTDQYLEFMKWAGEVSKQSVAYCEKGQIPPVYSPH